LYVSTNKYIIRRRQLLRFFNCYNVIFTGHDHKSAFAAASHCNLNG